MMELMVMENVFVMETLMVHFVMNAKPILVGTIAQVFFFFPAKLK